MSVFLPQIGQGVSPCEKLLYVSKEEIPACLKRFRKNAAVFGARIKYSISHCCILSRKKIMKMIINDYQLNHKNIDIKKADKIFKKVYKSSPQNRKLIRKYNKLKNKYKSPIPKASQSTKNPKIKSLPDSLPKAAEAWKAAEPAGDAGQPLLGNRPNTEVDVPSAAKDAESPKPRRRRRRQIKLSGSSEETPDKKTTVTKPRRRPIVIRSRKGDGKAFDEWKKENAEIGFLLSGEGVIEHYGKLLNAKKTLGRLDNDYDIVKASYVSSLSFEAALTLYTTFSEEETFLFNNNVFLRSGLEAPDVPGDLVDADVEEMSLPKDANEMGIYIVGLDFEELSNERVQDILEYTLEKIAQGDDKIAWEFSKQMLASNMLLEQAEYLLDLEKYGNDLHAYFIRYNKSLRKKSFDEAVKMDWRDLLESFQQWHEYPDMVKFVKKLKNNLAHNYPIDGLNAEDLGMILNALNDAELQMAFSARANRPINEGL